MTSLQEFGYTQARIQARYGKRVSDSVWQHLAALQGLSAYLEEARATTLAPWVAGFSLASDNHDIEQAIREHFLTSVGEVAGWVPEAWRAAVNWVNWLPDLPLLQHLLNGREILTWANRSPRLASYLPNPGRDVREGIILAGGEALVQAWEQGEPLDKAWIVYWRASWPACGRRQRRNLDALVALLQNHRSEFTGLGLNRSWTARRILQWQLHRLFRRCLLQPVTVFTYLCLIAIDLERLRSALVDRALFTLDRVP
jgi:hypothetical protein